MSFFSKPGCTSTRGLVEKFVTSGEYSWSDACTVGVRRIGNEVSDLCIGKPAVRSLPLSTAAGDLVAALRRVPRSGSATIVAVFTGPDALVKPVSALLCKDGAGEVRPVDRVRS
jgi:hypothetical protein